MEDGISFCAPFCVLLFSRHPREDLGSRGRSKDARAYGERGAKKLLRDLQVAYLCSQFLEMGGTRRGSRYRVFSSTNRYFVGRSD